MPRTTVSEVLACFEDEFAEFAEGFCRGEYLLWLGSGISRDVVPNVAVLLRRMLEYLRTNIDAGDPTCRFKTAFQEILDVGGVSADTRATLDLAAAVDRWAEIDDIVGRLVDHYSDVLDVQVRGEPEDFLVWTGLDVPATYGDPGLEPDVEHLCVAVLMLEGVVRSVPTTNWDGLVEAGMERLTGDARRFLQVIVAPEDFRESPRPELVKFHGCAVRAGADEHEYRGRLIARKAQISGWTTRPENQLMKQHLEFLFSTRSAFVVGLSAQDANIHTVLNQAIQNLVRTWPASPPTVVFAEQVLHHHHRHVLKVTYGDSYSGNVDAIGESAVLGAYAKPALVGLVLFVLADKLSVLIASVPELTMAPADVERLRANLRHLRDTAAGFADLDLRSFVDAITSGLALLLTVFRFGKSSDLGADAYQPVSTTPVGDALRNPDFPAAALGRLAVGLALLGRGLAEAGWTVGVGSADRPVEGVVRIANGRRIARTFMVADSRALSQLVVDGIVDLDDDEILVLQAQASVAAPTRSPRAHYGRTGAARARCLDLEELCETVSTADELFEAFRLDGGL